MEELEEMSAAQLLFADDFTLYADHIPLRPVGPAVNTTVLASVASHRSRRQFNSHQNRVET